MAKPSLRDLKEKLLAATEFAKVSDLFWEEFALDREFLNRGKPSTDKEFMQFLGVVVQKLVGKEELAIAILALVEISEEQFIHGAFMVDGRPGMVFYFAEERVGLMSVSEPGSGMSQFVRFTGRLATDTIH